VLPDREAELRLSTAWRRDHVDTTPNRVPSDPASSYRAIENLIASYAELVDDGDFAGVGTLLADATLSAQPGR
jgi:hypothetical protein